MIPSSWIVKVKSDGAFIETVARFATWEEARGHRDRLLRDWQPKITGAIVVHRQLTPTHRLDGEKAVLL